jgi:hypothetical protein
MGFVTKQLNDEFKMGTEPVIAALCAVHPQVGLSRLTGYQALERPTVVGTQIELS